MEQPLRSQDTTLNSNIAKELVWKRNSPYFYQTLYTQELQWPSLSVEWWVDQHLSATKKKDQQSQQLYNLIYGTYTSGGQKNYLVFAKVYLPNQQYIKKQRMLRPSEAIKKNDNAMQDRILAMFQVQHEGEVHQIKHNPNKKNLIATRASTGDVYIYEKTRFKSGKHAIPPVVTLIGHQSDGYSIQWNPHKQGYIIAGSYDSKLTLWDIKSKEQGNKIHPFCHFNFHNKQIQDVSHNQFHDSIFASCDDQGQVVVWDTRNSKQPVHYFTADSSPLNSVQFSKHNKHLFATGGSQKTIKLWDIRNMSEPIASVADFHNQQIKQLKWSTQDYLWVASGNNITMWDINEQSAKFVHSGHKGSINQISLHPEGKNTVASVDQENEIHIYQPTHNVFE